MCRARRARERAHARAFSNGVADARARSRLSARRSFEKRHKNLAAHVSPCFINPKEGDIVTVGQCRPLSKTVRFNVIAHEPSANQALNVKKQFRVF